MAFVTYWPCVFIVRTLTIDTLGCKVLRVRVPRLLVTVWWKKGPHVRMMPLPKMYRPIKRKWIEK